MTGAGTRNPRDRGTGYMFTVPATRGAAWLAAVAVAFTAVPVAGQESGDAGRILPSARRSSDLGPSSFHA